MKKTIKLNTTVREGQRKTIVRVGIQDDQIAEWCLSLSLLNFDLIDTLSIIGEEQPKLKVKKDAKLITARGSVSKDANDIELIISQDELDYWLSFFLQYYRDGVGDVDHIDVDITTWDKSSDCDYFYLTLEVSKMKSPIPWEEASKMLKNHLDN